MSDTSTTGGNALALSRLYLEMGQPQQALEALGRVSTDQIEEPFFWLLQAQAYYDMDRLESAKQAVRQGLNRAPEHPFLLLLLTNCESKLGNLAAAERAILAALHRDPEDPTLLCRYALLLAKGDQLDKAEALVARASQYAPEDASIRSAEALLAYLRGDDRRAMDASLEALEKDPESIYHRQMLGGLLMEQGQVQVADRYLRAAARSDPGRRGVVEAARVSRQYAHWLLWPLRPLYRWGAARVWIVCVGSLFILDFIGLSQIAGPLTIAWIGYCVYSWVVPPLVKWWLKRRYGAFR
jgi:predicted Zn-dependent protease